MRSRAWLSAAGALLVVGVIFYSRFSAEPPARRAARNLLLRAQAAHVHERGDEEFDLLLRALTTDPTYMPALIQAGLHTKTAYMWSQVRPQVESVLAGISDRSLAACARRLMLIQHALPAQTDAATVTTPAARACMALVPLLDGSLATRPAAYRAAALAMWRKYPEAMGSAEFVTDAEFRVRDWTEAVAVGKQLVDQGAAPPLARVYGARLLVDAYRHQNNDTAAARVNRQMLAILNHAPRTERFYYYFLTRQFARLLRDSVPAIADRVTRLPFELDQAVAAYSNGELRVSELLWNRFMSNYADVPELHLQGLIFRGRTHLKAGELGHAEADLLEARRQAPGVPQQGMATEVEHNLFHVYEAESRTADALQAGQNFLANANLWRTPGQRLTAFHDLGWYYWRLGDYERARPLLAHMLGIIDSLQAYRTFAGEYYERTGDLERALRAYQTAASEDQADGRSVGRMALLAAQMGDSAKAMRLARAHDESNNPQYPEFTPLLPAVLASFGMRSAAARAAEHAQLIAATRNQGAALANLQLQRAQLQIALGEPQRARVLADSAAANAQKVAALETEILARATRALAAQLATRQSALDTLEQLLHERSTHGLPQTRLQIQTLLGDAQAASAHMSGALAAYAQATQLKDSLAATLDSDFERARLRSARTELSNKALALIIRSRAPQRIELYQRWSARRKDPAAADDLLAGIPRMRVSAGSAVLDYVVLDSVVAALMETPTANVLRVLPVDARTLQLQVATFREEIAPRLGSAIDVAHASFDAQLAHTLYLELVAPFAPELEDVSELTIVADGVLHELPFEPLLSQAATDGQDLAFLLRRYAIRYSPSLASARAARPLVRGTVLAVAGDAPNAAGEVAAIARTAPAPGVRVLRLSAATEADVRTLAPRSAIIHFATHATMNDVEPRFAYLALAKEGADDGRLHAYEIEKWRLAGQLVILSGCDTGNGRRAGGEGVLSMSRAFLQAGASATIATLWPVGSASGYLLGRFYAALARGATPAEALRTAKLQALQGPYASPLYWAPFVLVTT